MKNRATANIVLDPAALNGVVVVIPGDAGRNRVRRIVLPGTTADDGAHNNKILNAYGSWAGRAGVRL